MAPHVALIVTGVVIGVGAAYVVGKHIYPKVQPHVEEFIRACRENVQSRRRSEHPYTSMPSEDVDLPRDSAPADHHESKEMESKSSAPGEPMLSTVLSTGASTPRSTLGGLRQRPQAANATAAQIANEKLLDTDVEMVQFDRAKSAFYPLMTPTSTRPSSRGPSPLALEDDNPFQEPSVPVAVAIPLPQSPDVSLLLDPLSRSNQSTSRPQPSATMPYEPAMAGDNAAHEHPLQTPVATEGPSLPPSSRSISSSTPQSRGAHGSISGVLSPPSLPLGIAGTIRDLPSTLPRPSSPSNASDHMSGNWTDGGTVDIFSGSEHDSGFHDSDEDGVRSVSDSDEWEEVDALRVASPPAGAINRRSDRI